MVKQKYCCRNIPLSYGNNKWELLKSKQSDILPPYADNKFFISNFPNLFQSYNEQIRQEKNISNLKGDWAVDCNNGLTTLNIDNKSGLLSLYSHNDIYINLDVEKSPNANEYLLKYSSLSSQRNYNDDKLKIVDEDISKDEIIGKLTIKKDGNAELYWIGLYNLKRRKLEFIGKDFLLISENGEKNPVSLEECK